MRETWVEILISSFREVMERLAQVTPRILAMLTLIVLGLIVGAFARRLAARVLQAADFDRRCARWRLTPALTRAGFRESPTVLTARLVFWTIFLVALLMGIEALEMPAATGLVAMILRFLPDLIVATLVMVTGWVLANFLGQAALIGAVNAQVAGAPLIAAAVRWMVLVFTGAAALTQLGIAREMVLLAFGIAFGGTVLALALAFGLGGKDLAREILESRLGKHEEDTDQLTHV
ncbi:MAG TPA: hypothetical protein VLT62_04490 [Candidatus Methylomirabilis sp.]|nr:hypothetical protein [Candidatus Methylomirabilis sp.]